MNTKVPVGPSTVLGWLGFAGGLITTVSISIAENQTVLAGPGKWAAILAIVSLVATNLGRQFQAAHLTKAAGVADDISSLPTAMQALAAEAQKNLSVVAAHPDGVDSAAVPFSGAPSAPMPTTPPAA